MSDGGEAAPALKVIGRSGLLSPDANESPKPTTSRSSTTTLGSANSRPSASFTLTDTPEADWLGE